MMAQTIWMMDLLLESVAVVGVFVLADMTMGRRLKPASRHLLWLACVLCLTLLPLAGPVSLWLTAVSDSVSAPGALFELRVDASQSSTSGHWHIGSIAATLYGIIVAVLLARMLFAAVRLRSIVRRAKAPGDNRVSALQCTLRESLQINRPVRILSSSDLDSPVSCGLFRPLILLPDTAHQWSETVMTDVLMHELCHIKRLDWLSAMLCYLVAAVFWLNPLVWLVARRLHEESENSCDAAVVSAGRINTDYAESLLGVATGCIRARRSRRTSALLMQTMHDQHTLKTRISRVLEEEVMNAVEMKQQVQKTIVAVAVMSTVVLGLLGSSQVLTAQERPDAANREIDREMIPLNTVEPMYPSQAAEKRIEGWVHVRFTVKADGAVDSESLRIMEAEPPYVFDHTALAAAKRFIFSPRIVAGQAVDVPNVQYVFRYALSNPDVTE
jgi:TonB family protein